jgi:2'-5' RNA ligase
MSDNIRAFLSIELLGEVKTALARLVDEVAGARVNGLKPVKSDHLHITLKFFGDVTTEQVKSITNVVTTASKGIRPFTLKLGGVGVYPNSKNARVLWVGLDGDVGPLQDAQRRIDKALERIDIEPESREFSPHLTIARIRDGTLSGDRRRATEALFSAEFNSRLTIPVNSVSLVRSVLLPEGPEYMRLADISLGGNNGV